MCFFDDEIRNHEMICGGFLLLACLSRGDGRYTLEVVISWLIL